MISPPYASAPHPRPRWSPGRGVVSGAVVPGLLTVLLLATPSAWASPAVRDVAPYVGASGYGTHSPVGGNLSCPKSGSYTHDGLVAGPSALPATGRLLAADSACGRSTAAIVSAQFWTTSSLTSSSFGPGLAGHRTVTYHWHVHLSAAGTCRILGLVSHAAPCSARAVVLLYGDLYDNTTGASVLAAPLFVPVLNDTATNAFHSFSANLTHNYTLRFNVSLSTTDQYEFTAWLYTSVSTMARGWTYNTGQILVTEIVSVRLDAGTAGHGAWVTSMNLS
ncbi:MAG TPA: hypothetical protein VN864_06355 [Thermoplasmata archaeon]|nr:hypothetical protein [Thermoplasmata archaeon]